METHEQTDHLLKGWRLTVLLLTVVTAVVFYLLFTLWGGWNDVLAAFQTTGFLGIIGALALALLNYLLRFLRWQYYLNALKCEVPWLKSLRIYLMGFSLTITPAKAGEALRSIFLRDFGVSYHTSFGVFLSERVSDLIAVLLISSVGLLIFSGIHIYIIPIGIVVAMVIIVLQQEKWLMAIENWALNYFPARFGNFVHFIIDSFLAFRTCYSFKSLTVGIGLGVLAWGAEGTAFYYILHILKQSQITFATAQFIYSFSLLIGAISFLPGGLGAAEVVMFELLRFHGVPSADAVAATIIIRAATVWFAVVLGVCLLPFRRLQFR